MGCVYIYIYRCIYIYNRDLCYYHEVFQKFPHTPLATEALIGLYCAVEEAPALPAIDVKSQLDEFALLDRV